MSTKSVTGPDDERYILDEWPRSADGTEWDGTHLMHLIQDDASPFGDALDVVSLVKEIEYSLDTIVNDLPLVAYGANHFVSLMSHAYYTNLILCHMMLTRSGLSRSTR